MARQEEFVFIPSLIWVVPGWRRPDQVTFDLKSALEPRRIHFVHATAQRIDPERAVVVSDQGEFHYDYLLIATGPRFDWDAIPGLGPHGGYTHSICSLPHAQDAARAWREFLKDPGPVALGATQYASCFGAEYEMVFNIDRALREAGVRDRAPITFISSEPFLGHFGIGGMKGGQKMLEWFCRWRDIKPVVNVALERVTPGEIHLQGGQVVPFKYAIVIPPFKGVDAIQNSPGVGDERGMVPTNDGYQHLSYRNIYAAGVAVAIKPPDVTPIPTGVPKTGYMSEVMAKVAAHNIAADILGWEHKDLPFADINALCIMDAGTQGVVLLSDRVFKPRKFELLIPGPWSHWTKLAFERYYMWKMATGRSYLP
ncbi:MAG TPA: FAD/NAD(P)-binding oxidoreductase [Chloroflexota bacterium]|nr:FAD/NAD(P)-binding oxidoreductase [Chloroflexota bacterium]